MADTLVNVSLSMENNITTIIQNVTENVRIMQNQVEEAKEEVKSFAQKANEGFKKAAKGVASMSKDIAKVALKTGFDEALNLEEYRAKLNNATKDTQIAGKVMKTAVSLANKSTFDTGELVDGATKFEEIGMSAEKWLPLAGNMAASSNKDFSSAADALADAQNGELEGLEEFGIEKTAIVKKAGEMFGDAQVMSNDGQIKDQEKFNAAMAALVGEKFAGGMKQQSSTIKGLWDQVTGTTKTALAKVLGMSEDGTIAAGSPLEKLKGIIQTVVDTIDELQSSGKLDEISKIIGGALTSAVDAASTAVSWLKDNMDWLLPIVAGVISGFLAFNAIDGVSKKISGLKESLSGISSISGLFKAGPIAMVAIAIGVLVAAFVIAYKKSETFRNFVDKLVVKFKEFATVVKDNVVAKMQEMGQWFDEKLKPKLDNLKSSLMDFWDNVLKPLIEWLQPVFAAGFAAGFEFISSTVSNVIATIEGVVSGLITVFTGIIEFVTGVFTGDWDTALNGIKDIFTGAFEGIKSVFIGIVNFIIDKINFFTQSFAGITDMLSEVTGKEWIAEIKIPEIPHLPEFETSRVTQGPIIPNKDIDDIKKYATGTGYFSGGLAHINEGGRGEIVNLPNGTQIIPHDISKRQSSQPIVNVSVNVQGNVIGNNEYANYIGGVVARRVVAAYGNM